MRFWALCKGWVVQFSATLRGWVTLFFTKYWRDSWLHLLYKTQPTGIIAKMLTNLLCEKIQRLKGRTSIRAWNPLWTVFLLFCKEIIGGSLKIYWSYSWFCLRFHFFIQASFIVDTDGWYCVTNGNISFSSLLFCFRSLDSLLWILFLIVGFLSKIGGTQQELLYFKSNLNSRYRHIFIP